MQSFEWQGKKTSWPCLWIRLNCIKAIEPLQGDSLLFTFKSPGIPGTHLIYPGRMKDRVDLVATQYF